MSRKASLAETVPDARSWAERDPEDLRRFIDLVDYRAAQRDKELYWRDWKKKHGPAAGIRIADELRRQVIAQRPSFPSDQERREDLEAHVREIEAFRRFDARRRQAPG
jgi:hypothetical protein